MTEDHNAKLTQEEFQQQWERLDKMADDIMNGKFTREVSEKAHAHAMKVIMPCILTLISLVMGTIVAIILAFFLYG